MSKFCGQFDCYKCLSLDRFDGANLHSTCYWLSHAHSDHMRGLSSKLLYSRLKTNAKVRIFCTDVTKKLLCTMRSYKHLEDFLVCLNIDEPTSVSIHALDYEQAEVVDVVFTAIAAGHCPGSAMLLVEGKEGTVLYTGDFRLEKGSARMIGALHDAQGNKKPVDSVYCDTTFLTPKLKQIPTREECEEELIQQVEEHISKGDNYHILIRAKAKIGYENVFRVLYDRLGIKTHIQSQDGYLYSRIPEILETITPNANSTQVHICCRFVRTEEDDDENEGVKLSSSATEVCEVLSRNSTVTKIIQLSTMWFITKDEKQIQVQTGPSTVRCCYSFHSSYSEIEDLIRYIEPHRAVPNVSPIGYSRDETQKLLEEFLSTESQSEIAENNLTWKSIRDVNIWWKRQKPSTSAVAGTCSPPAKRHKHETNDHSNTNSRESTPEINIFSDSEEETTSRNPNDPVQSDGQDGALYDYDSDDDAERRINSDYHCRSSSLELVSRNDHKGKESPRTIKNDIIKIKTVIDLTESQ